MNTYPMTVYSASNRIEPMLLPLEALGTDWFGTVFDPPVRFAFAHDAEFLHFVARHERPALCHPHSSCGKFRAELWKFDVAEFFLTDSLSGHYLEFNLAPNGAWWSCIFGAPLERTSDEDEPVPGVRTVAGEDGEGWYATASLPLLWLRKHFHFSPASRLNATFILESPVQRFLTARPLGKGDPAFHQPSLFPPVSITPWP